MVRFFAYDVRYYGMTFTIFAGSFEKAFQNTRRDG